MKVGKTLSLVFGLTTIEVSLSYSGTCALCRQALASGGSTGLINGFFWSIVLMAGIPLVVLAVGIGFARRYWK